VFSGGGMGAAPSGMSAPARPASEAEGVANDTMSTLGNFGGLERQYGLPEGYLGRTYQIESGGNPNAQNPNSSAGGLFQFIDSTAKQYGLANKMDPVASTEAAARLAADNKAVLARALGREPTAGELYLAHQQGGGGATKLLANPNARAVDVVGADAVRLNGGNPNMTAAEFASRWVSKVDGAQPVQMARADAPADGAAEAQGFAVPGGAPAAAAARQGINPQMIRTLLANPGTREVGKALWQQTMTGKSFGFQVVGDQLYRTNPQTGAVEPVGVSKPVQPVTVSPGQRLVDPRTGQVVYEGGAGFKNLTSPEERATFGISPDDRRPYQVGPDGKLINAGGAQNTVNVDTKGESEYAKKVGGALAERMDAVSKEGDTARTDQILIGQLRDLGGQIKNMGAGAALQGRLAEFGIKVGDNVSEIEAYRSIVDKLTPQQRVPGTGASSDLDVKMFKSSLPALVNTPGGNALILDTLEAVAADKAARAAIADRALVGELKPQDALKAFRELPDPLAKFKEARKGGFKADTPPAQTGQPRAVATPQDYQALKPGDQYVDPQGNIRTKR